MKDQVEEMTRFGLKAFAIGFGEWEAEKELNYDVDIICMEVRVRKGSDRPSKTFRDP